MKTVPAAVPCPSPSRTHALPRSPRTRRRAGPALALAAALVTTAAVAAARDDGAPPVARRAVTYPTRTMGTYAHVMVVTADSAASAPAARAAIAEFARLDSLMSNWTTTSEVARVNRVAADGPTPLEREVADVVELSMEVYRESEGAFDITVEPLVRAWGFLGGPRRVPSEAEARAAAALVGSRWLRFDPVARTLAFERRGMRIDLGGIAKGYAVDVAARALAEHGVTDALVDLSGNMRAIGAPPGADHWNIGVRDPRDRMPYFARLALRPGEGISTSAKYEQFVAQDGRTYGHIMDPRTGRPADGLLGVTLVCPTALLADAWDTPLFVLGADGAKRKARELKDVSALIVQPGTSGVDTVWVESTLRDRFELEPEARAFFRVMFF